MLEHRRVGAADRQVQRAARLLPRGKADHRGLGDVGQPVADDLAPAADHRRLDETEFRSEEHTSELQSLMRISYAVFCLKKKNIHIVYNTDNNEQYPNMYTI